MKNVLLTLSALIFLSGSVYSQFSNHRWLFGNGNAGIRFDTATNQPFQYNVKANPYGSEATTTVVNERTGDLIFYTDGERVYDLNHNQVAIGLGGSSSHVQCPVFPAPCGCDEYYLISSSAYGRGGRVVGETFSTLVQMRSGNVLVPTASKAVRIEQSVYEGMVVIPKIGSPNYWIIGVKFDGRLYVKEASCTGFGASQYFDFIPQGAPVNPQSFVMKYHPNSGKIALAYSSNSGRVALIDFNANTGQLSNFSNLSITGALTYEAEWSPNGRFLYVAKYLPSTLYQYDLINNTRTTIYSGGGRGGGVKLGPDNRIYHITNIAGTQIARVNSPDLAGAASNHALNAFNLGTSVGGYRFGETVGTELVGYPDPFGIQARLPNCEGDSLIVNTLGFGWLQYRWEGPQNFTQNTPNLAVPNITNADTGWYVVTAFKGNCEIKDSVYLGPLGQGAGTLNLGPDTLICNGSNPQLTLNATMPSATSYRWQNGSNLPTFTATQSGIYWVEVTNACGVIRDSIVVGILATPAPINLGVNRGICTGDTVRYSAPLGNGLSYLWDNGETTAQRSPVTQTTTVWVQVSNACGSTSDTTQINLVPLPTISNFPGDTVICAGDSLQLNPSISNGGFGWADTTLPQLNRTITRPGTYTLIVGSVCGTTQETFTLNHINPPLPFSLGNDTSLCPSQSLNLDITQPNVTYQWSDGDSLPLKSVSDAGWIWAEATNICGTFRDSVFITALPAPFVDLGNDTSLCRGDSIAIRAIISGATWSWDDGSTDTTRIFNVGGWYWVDATTVCGTVRDSIRVYEIIVPPVIDLGNDTTVCEGDSLRIGSQSLASQYLWDDGRTDSFRVATTSGLYIQEVTNACGVTTDSIELTFLPLPRIFLGNDTFLCSGDLITIDIRDTVLGTVLWNDGSTDSVRTFFAGDTIWAEATTTCGTIRDSLIINEIQPPIPFSLGPDISLCPGQIFDANVMQPQAQYQWSDGDTAATRAFSSGGVFWVNVFNECGIQSDTIIISSPTPPEPFNLGSDTTLCDGESYTLYGPEGDSLMYLWSDGSMEDSLVIDQEGTYWLDIVNECGSQSDTFVLTILYVPQWFSLGPDTLLCAGDSLTLSAFQGLDVRYNWLEDTIAFSTSTVSETGVYTLEISNVCDTVSDRIFVTKIPRPNADIGSDTTLCDGEILTLTHENRRWVNYFWYSGDEGPEFIVDRPGRYGLRASNVCDTIEREIIVEYEDCDCNFYMPNAFSPNQDGKNDKFGPVYDCPIRNFEMTIFDRWGKIVYYTTSPDAWWDGTHQRGGKHVQEGVYVWKVSFEGKANRIYTPKQHVGTVTLIR